MHMYNMQYICCVHAQAELSSAEERCQRLKEELKAAAELKEKLASFERDAKLLEDRKKVYTCINYTLYVLLPTDLLYIVYMCCCPQTYCIVYICASVLS